MHSVGPRFVSQGSSERSCRHCDAEMTGLQKVPGLLHTRALLDSLVREYRPGHDHVTIGHGKVEISYRYRQVIYRYHAL